jgi:hypothetical protein
MANENALLVGLVIAMAIISMVVTGVLVSNIDVKAPAVNIDSEALASAVASKISVPVAEVPANPKVDEIYEELLGDSNKEKAMNKTAIELSLAELQSRDGLKAIMAFLNDNEQDVEEYKDVSIDVETIKVSDTEVDIDAEGASIEITFKVDFFNDGDSELEGRAKIIARYAVDLEEDEQEAELDGLELVRFYNLD